MAILCDFDDTAADRNVATLLLNRFQPVPLSVSAPHWRELHQRYLRAEITLAEYQEIAFAQMPSSQEEQAAYVKEQAALRPGFVELAGYCADHGIELAIVSHGLDFYVRALLEESGLEELPFFAVHTSETDGRTSFNYCFSSEGCDWFPGNCKCYIIDEYRERGKMVLYAGDGISDTCPARKADYVFARDSLLSFCRAQEIPHLELTDFHVVLDYVRSLPADMTP